jgi:flagellar biogenesis protein FliO
MTNKAAVPGGLAGWLLTRWRSRGRTEPRLAVLERITLAPRQTLSLVEVEGRRFLIAGSADGAPAFCRLDGRAGGRTDGQTGGKERRGRISW